MGILKNELMRIYDKRPSTAELMMEITEIVDKIAKSEYEHGKSDKEHTPWIEKDNDVSHQCPVCKEVYEWWDAEHYNYCPNCGAYTKIERKK